MSGREASERGGGAWERRRGLKEAKDEAEGPLEGLEKPSVG